MEKHFMRDEKCLLCTMKKKKIWIRMLERSKAQSRQINILE